MIVIDPDICNGKPVLRNKRITVQTILEYLSEHKRGLSLNLVRDRVNFFQI